MTSPNPKSKLGCESEAITSAGDRCGYPTKESQPIILPAVAARKGTPRSFFSFGVMLLLFGICLLSLAGCSSFSVPDQLLDYWPLRPPPTPETISLRVSAWSMADQERSHFTRALDDIHARAPNVQIDQQFEDDYDRALRAALADPEIMPDVLFATGLQLPELTQLNAVAPIPPSLTRRQDLPDTLRHSFSAWTPESVTGSDACFPLTANTLVLAYNRTLFDRVDLPYPTAAWTWQDLRTAAETLTDTNVGLYGLTMSLDLSRWLPFYLQAGGNLEPSDTWPRFESEAAQLSLTFYLNLFAQGLAVEPTRLDSTWVGEAFGRGRAAMAVEGSWLLPFLQREFPQIDYGLVELPSGPAGQATVSFVTCLAVSNFTHYPDAALAVAAYLTDPIVLATWLGDSAGMPAYVSMLDEWLADYPAGTSYVSSLEHAQAWRLGPSPESKIDAFNRLLRDILEEEVPAADAVPQLLSSLENDQ